MAADKGLVDHVGDNHTAGRRQHQCHREVFRCMDQHPQPTVHERREEQAQCDTPERLQTSRAAGVLHFFQFLVDLQNR